MEQKETKNTAAESMKRMAPHIKAAAEKGGKLLEQSSEKMVDFGGRLNKTLPEYVPGLAQICIIQAGYSLSLGVLSVATGSDGLISVAAAHLPLVVFAAAAALKKLKK